MAFDEETDSIKKGNKGVPMSESLKLDTYLNTLLGQTTHNVEVRNLRMNQDRQMSRQHLKKTGLSDISVKVHVLDDKITCFPLQQNNQYM